MYGLLTLQPLETLSTERTESERTESERTESGRTESERTESESTHTHFPSWISHPLTAIRGGDKRLALVAFLPLGANHAWYPWQALGAVYTRLLWHTHTHTHTHTQFIQVNIIP